MSLWSAVRVKCCHYPSHTDTGLVTFLTILTTPAYFRQSFLCKLT